MHLSVGLGSSVVPQQEWWLQWQKWTCSEFWKLGVQDQGVAGLVFSEACLPWVADNHLLAMISQDLVLVLCVVRELALAWALLALARCLFLF